MKTYTKYFALIVSLIVLHSTTAYCQYTRYIVKLKNKGGTPHSIANATTYLSQRAISRRSKQNISIDSTDLPITPRYLDSIRAVPGVTVLNYSKWLNQVAIKVTNTTALPKINSFNFVQITQPLAAKTIVTNGLSTTVNKLYTPITTLSNITTTTTTSNTLFNYGNSAAQINIHNGAFLHNLGYTGNGINMAIMDAGFFSYANNQGLDSARANNQIKETWDYVDNEPNVNNDDSHGWFCMSIIAANRPGIMVGTAPKANYYLYRTEDVYSEYPIEEQNWIAAAERADSIGVEIFSTSLGYLDFDDNAFTYSYAQRNGNFAMMTRAADLAAKKGILVCNSAGNNGNGNPNYVDYKYMAVPADADSILSVGACTFGGVSTNFSAWGPTFSGRIKPNVTSVGLNTTVLAFDGTAASGSGTSFSNPNMAGLATCLLQALPALSNMQIIDVLQRSCPTYATPDGRLGYGVPNMKAAYVLGLKEKFAQQITINNCFVNVQYTLQSESGKSGYNLQRMLPGQSNFTTIKSVPTTTQMITNNITYSIRDTIPQGTAYGQVSYRIQHIVNNDTTFFFSPTAIGYTQGCNNTTYNTNAISIAPSPFSNQLGIYLGATTGINNYAIRISDSKGAIVYKNANTGSNNSTLLIATDAWQRGAYTVSIIGNNGKIILAKKVIKQ